MNSLYDSARSSRSKWITVSNLPREANENWLKMLFAPAGVVESVHFSMEDCGGVASLLFAEIEQAKKALELNGFNALGISLDVRARPDAPEAYQTNGQKHNTLVLARPNNLPTLSNHFTGPFDRNNNQNKAAANNHYPMDSAPTHKNLYVLNLPLDATPDQLTALFAAYGNVVHCVILAMLDAQARRRGFIDMSSPKEAKEAIEGLNGFVWHGYPIEVSYAIVQRSGGPFDQNAGRPVIKRNVPRNRFNTGPRRIPSDSAIDPSVMANLTHHFSQQVNVGQGHNIVTPHALHHNTTDQHSGGAVVDPYTIFIAGMDPAAIIDDDDFRTALEHYGAITAATLCRDENGTSRGFGIVTFATQQAATNVCETINGKVIEGRRLTAHKYVYQPPSAQGAMNPFLQASSPLSRRDGPNANNAGPLMPLRFNNRSSLPTPWSGSNRISQGPVGSIGMQPSQMPNWPIRENPPEFFKLNTGSRPIEIRPDPDNAKKLADAFVPTTKANSTNQNQNSPEQSIKQASAGVGEHPVISRTPITSNSPWSSSTVASTNSLGLDGLSPQSTISMSSTALQTPESIRDRDSAGIWSNTHGSSRNAWSNTNKHANLAGSAILSLQSDVVEKNNNRPSMAMMAPVGHEKTSSPLRIMNASNNAH